MNIQQNNQVEDLNTYTEERKTNDDASKPISDDWKEKVNAQGKTCSKNMNEPRYLLTVFEMGDNRWSFGSVERKDVPRRYFVPNASLNDIKKYIEQIDNPHWRHPLLSSSPKEEIPHKEKKWSVVYDFSIEPMTKELEDSYVDGVKIGFFKDYRRMYGTQKEMLPNNIAEKNFEEGFEKDTFIIEHSEGSKVS
jgi:hypothetical protein|tara:strand:+ start:147 stop:725 length:579 start_codon:yes stop_codon:yes gene_type:complete